MITPPPADKASAWRERHPVLAILAVSLLAVVINCYPIIFCNRSYVSPACHETLVYNWQPGLPGINHVDGVDVHGSDAAAIMLWAVPVGFIESRSVLEQGELPLWNRYGHAGDTLIGQALSMLGDPLQWIVILGHGSAVAWDIKFLTAKFLFCAGFGLLILKLFRSVPLSLIFTALGAWCGAFFFIYNHPVFFVFCYTPWILLSALRLLEPVSHETERGVSHSAAGGQPKTLENSCAPVSGGALQVETTRTPVYGTSALPTLEMALSRRRIVWGLVWLLANVACFNAGHVETAVLLIGGLNLAALAHALSCCRGRSESAWVLGRLAVGTILFAALTAPVWMSFLASLEGSYSTHGTVRVVQLPLANLPGIFDDLFYLLPLRLSSAPATGPGTSLLVLAGCLLSVLRWRQLKQMPFFWVNVGAIVLWGGCVFAWVPASWLALVPLLNRIGHTYTDFSYLLVIHLTLQSAYGFWSLGRPGGFQRLAVHFMVVALVIGGMILTFALTTLHQAIPWDYFLCASAGAVGAPLLFVCLRNRPTGVSSLGWAGILLLGFLAQCRFGLYSSGNEKLMMLVGPRAVLNAPSKAVETIKADKSGVFRTVGLQWSFFGDYSAVYGLEDIRSCAPLSNGEYMELLQHFPGMVLNYSWILEVKNLAAAQPLLNLLNVKYILAPPSMTIQTGLDFRVAARSDFCVVENPDVWPRAFFCDQVISIPSTEDFIGHLLRNPKQPFVALTPQEMERQPALRALETSGPRSVQPASNYQLGPNSTAFDVHASSAGVICLTEGQAKDFIAKANGQPKTVLTVNRAFKAIYLDKPGDYHVEFVYRPHHWRLACALFWTAIGAVIALACACAIWPRKRPATAS